MAKKVSFKETTERDLMQAVVEARETVRAERFKDKLSRKAGTIRAAKLTVARALTELSARRTVNTK